MKTLCISLLLLPASLLAQSPSNPLVSGSKAIYTLVSTNVVKAAEEMPEENYSFKPSADVRSFGQVVGHVADAQYGFCGAVLADGTKGPGIEKNKTSKADIVQGLKDAIAYCGKAYAALTDAQAPETVKFFGHDSPKLTILDFNVAHTDEHYGNLVTYLRMKGLTPPSSQGR
jgi:uncharacterized damage-inducible protein DinB